MNSPRTDIKVSTGYRWAFCGIFQRFELFWRIRVAAVCVFERRLAATLDYDCREFVPTANIYTGSRSKVKRFLRREGYFFV
jgi:hypothetical protein